MERTEREYWELLAIVELAKEELQRLMKETQQEITKQTAVVKDLEKGYEELNSALEDAKAREDPRRIRAYSNALAEVGVELDAAKDKLASLKVLQGDIRSEIRSTGSNFTEQVQKMSAGVSKLNKLISRIFVRFIGFQIVFDTPHD